VIISKDSIIGFIKWWDNKIICLGINCINSDTPDIVRRFGKKEKMYTEISRSKIVQLYNNFMGDVDLHDQLISYYRVFIKSKNKLFAILI